MISFVKGHKDLNSAGFMFLYQLLCYQQILQFSTVGCHFYSPNSCHPPKAFEIASSNPPASVDLCANSIPLHEIEDPNPSTVPIRLRLRLRFDGFSMYVASVDPKSPAQAENLTRRRGNRRTMLGIERDVRQFIKQVSESSSGVSQLSMLIEIGLRFRAKKLEESIYKHR